MVDKPVAVSAGLVLIFFTGIAILDSIHYKPAGTRGDTAPSVLDTILAPMGENYEKTYSAPLALHLYNKVTVLENGKPAQVYLRLRHISDQLQTNEDVKSLALTISVKSMGIALLTTMAGVPYRLVYSP